MTISEFVKAVQAYYCAYKEMTRIAVERYLQQFDVNERKELFNYLLLEYSGQYKYAPDIAVIDQVWQKYKGRITGNYVDENGNVFRKNKRIGGMWGHTFYPSVEYLKETGRLPTNGRKMINDVYKRARTKLIKQELDDKKCMALTKIMSSIHEEKK